MVNDNGVYMAISRFATIAQCYPTTSGEYDNYIGVTDYA